MRPTLVLVVPCENRNDDRRAFVHHKCDVITDIVERAQFVGKNVSAPLKLSQDIKNISGATLSCRHITDGVKRILATYEIALK